MLELQGIAVSPGVAIGKVLILDQEGYRITRSQIDSSDRNNEAQRLRQAIDEASSRLDEHRQRSAEKLGKKLGLSSRLINKCCSILVSMPSG